MSCFKYSPTDCEVFRSCIGASTPEEYASVLKIFHTRLPPARAEAVTIGHTTTLAYDFDGGFTDELPLTEAMKYIESIEREATIREPGDRFVRRNRAVLNVAREFDVVVTGMQATYAMVRHLRKQCKAHRSARIGRKYSKVRGVAEAMLKCQIEGCKLSARHVDATAAKVIRRPSSEVYRAMQSVAMLQRIYQARRAASVVRAAEVGLTAAEDETMLMFDTWYGDLVLAPGVVFLREGLTVYCLGTTDLQRADQVLRGILNSELALSLMLGIGSEHADAIARTHRGMTADMLDAARHIPQGDEVHLCKAYKAVWFAALAGHAGPESAGGVAKLVSDLPLMPHMRASRAHRWLKTLQDSPLQVILDGGKVWKLCPPPDGGVVEALEARKLKSAHPNPRVPIAADRPPLPPDLLRRALRDEVFTAAARYRGEGFGRYVGRGVEPRWWAEWMRAGVVPPEFGWATLIEARGVFDMPSRNDLDPSTFKDSAVAPAPFRDAALNPVGKFEGNMLLSRVTDRAYPTLQQARGHLKRRHYQKVDTKPEGHKAPMRTFFEATAADRQVLSWMESAVDRIARHHPCYMIGASPNDVSERIQSMVRSNTVGESVRLFSFDIDNWSGGMNAEVQQISHDVWAELYDSPEFANANRYMIGVPVYCEKQGFFAAFVNSEANFEGQNGKELTMMHLGLMSAVVQRARQTLRRDDFQVQLAAYIDDGLAAMRDRRGRASATFAEFMKCVREVYEYYGFRLSVEKCFPSDRLATFLNEVYYAGDHVTHGMRAAMRIASEPKDAHDSLPDRIQALAAGVQGASKAGLGCSVAWIMGVFLAVLELAEWVDLRNVPPQTICHWLLAPSTYGGLSWPSLLASSKTGRGASLAESIAACQSAAAAWPGLAPAVVNMLRTEVRRRSALAVFQNPVGSPSGGLLPTNRVARAVADALPKIAKNPQIASVITAGALDKARAFAETILPVGSRVAATTLVLLEKATPFNLPRRIASKLERGASIRKVVGVRTMRKILLAQRTDAAEAFAYFRSL